MDKKVLDPCCATKSMWFDKNDLRCHFADSRKGIMKVSKWKSQKGRSDKVVKPCELHDFRKMNFANNSFYHIVFDPPHLRNLSEKSAIGFMYGSLDPKTWRDDLKRGFAECFRVLKPNGTLIFKWNEIDIPLKEILRLTDQKPLYGHKSGKKAKTHWVAFIKD